MAYEPENIFKVAQRRKCRFRHLNQRIAYLSCFGLVEGHVKGPPERSRQDHLRKKIAQAFTNQLFRRTHLSTPFGKFGLRKDKKDPRQDFPCRKFFFSCVTKRFGYRGLTATVHAKNTSNVLCNQLLERPIWVQPYRKKKRKTRNKKKFEVPWHNDRLTDLDCSPPNLVCTVGLCCDSASSELNHQMSNRIHLLSTFNST